jgi:hypothetical protein
LRTTDRASDGSLMLRHRARRAATRRERSIRDEDRATPKDGLRFHPQHPRAIRDGDHGFDGIRQQVQDDLLQLDSAAEDTWERLDQLGVDRDSRRVDLAIQEGEDLTNELTGVKRSLFLVTLRAHRADTADHLARTMALIDHALQGGARFAEVGRRVCEPAPAHMAVCHDCCQGLVDVVRNGGGHLPHRRKACGARKLRLCHPQRILGTLALLARAERHHPVGQVFR